MKIMYFYLVSTGAYSSYDVEYIVTHTKKYSKNEMEAIINDVKREYIQSGGNINNYQVNMDKIGELIKRKLGDEGFTICYPIGEFHYDDYSKMEDITAWENREQSAFAEGLA